MISIIASQIFDSRGNPTICVTLTTQDHGKFEAQVPSGASKGSYEAHELRDGGRPYGGQGVMKAVGSVNDVIAPRLIKAVSNEGLKFDEQDKIDNLLRELDGTESKGRLGANALLAVSMVCARAGAALKGRELFEHIAHLAKMPTNDYILPVPFMNQINGGVHSGNPLAPQEFMIAPIGARSFSHAMQIGTEIYHALKAVITDKYGKAATGLGDEGGFAPPLKTPDEALSLLEQATISAGYRAHFQGPLDVGDVAFGVDPASSEFYDKHVQMYDLAFKFTRQERAEAADKMRLTGAELGQLYRDILQRHPIVLLEDPFAEDDFESWARFTQLHSENLEIVGDDLLATNPERIRIGIEKKLCNSLLLKINQIGTISEAINSAKLATRNGWSIFVSHRSGETVDDFIADLSVGLRAGHLKCGAPARGERLAKYNRLLAIENLLAARGGAKLPRYAGPNFRDTHKS